MRTLCFSLAVALACVSVPAAAESAGDEKTVIENAKNAVKMGLLDPYSAQFESVAVGMLDKSVQPSKDNPLRVVCGFVNAKNRFGGYVGRQPFSVDVNDDGTAGKAWIGHDQGTLVAVALTCIAHGIKIVSLN